MYRFFINEYQTELTPGKKLLLSERLIHQLKHVIRIKASEELIFIYQNYEISAHFIKNEAIIKNVTKFQIDQKFSLNLVQALPSPKLWSQILQKATELNVTSIFGWKSTYSNFPVDKFNTKFSRFSEIITEASEQTRRNNRPELSLLLSLDDFNFDSGLNLVFYENEKFSQNKWVSNLKVIQSADKINLFIGPEGGFSKEEIALFKDKANTLFLSLGTNILRTETASYASLAIINFIKTNLI